MHSRRGARWLGFVTDFTRVNRRMHNKSFIVDGMQAVVGGRNMPPARLEALGAHSLSQWRRNGFGPWAALDKAPGAWIGRIGLDELSDWPGDDKVEVGFELHAAWWGRGLAAEGARAALAFGFREHGLSRIISVTAASHTAARRVMEKIGLTYRGTRTWMNPNVPIVERSPA